MIKINYLLEISYDGKYFHGVIPQQNVKTVLGEILNFYNIKKCKYIVISRTDKGVSAEKNYIELSIDKEIKWEEFNHPYIKISRVFELKEFINIRKFSRGKLYYYYLPKTLFDEKYIFKPKYIIIEDYKIEIRGDEKEFDISLYKEAAKKFLGKHNFSNFAKGKAKNGICEIRKFEIEETDNYWLNKIEGNRFLYEMIRRIISFLVSVGKNRFPIDKIDLVFNGVLDPKPPPAPSEYLVLKNIYLDWVKLGRYIKKIYL